jgi:hypothetical protein
MTMADDNQQQQQQNQQGSGDGQQQQQQQQGGGEPFWNALPENMRGATAEETLKKVMPAYQGFHKAHSEREPALSKVEDLVLEITNDKAKPHFDPKSPMAQQFSKAAVELGLTKKQAAGIADKVMGGLAEAGAFADVLDVKATVTGIAKVLGHSELNDAAKQAVQQFETESLAWADNLSKQLKLSEHGQAELESLVLTPGGVELIKALRAQGGAGFAMGGQGGGQGAMTAEKLHAMGSDPRVDPMNAKYDKAVRAQYDAAWSAFYNKK